MVRICVFPNCGNKMTRWQCLSFHRLPLRDPDTLPSWLAVLQLNMQTPVHELREKDYRVCSEHFDDSDFSEKNLKDVPLKRRHLKRNAIPRAQSRPATVTAKGSDSADLKESESTAIPQSSRKISHKRKSSKKSGSPSTLTLSLSNLEQTRVPLKWKLIEDTDAMMSEMCIIQGCSGTEDLLSFPKDPSTRQQWMLCLDGRLKHPVNSSSKVCSTHFTSDSLAYWQQKQSGLSDNLFFKTGSLPSHLKDVHSELADPLSQDGAIVGGQCDLQQTSVTEDTGLSTSTPSHTQSKETTRNSSIMQDRNALMSDIVVKLACLLQLFQKCLKCCSDACSISTRRKGPILHVVQQCWSCGNTRDWTNQPPPDLLLPYPIVSSQAKEEPIVTSEDMEHEITIKIEEEEEAEEIEEEEEEEVEKEVEEEEEVTEEKEEEGESQNPKKRKRRDSDGEWVPNDEAFTETSDEESEDSEEEEEEEKHAHQWTWCCDCGVKASADCFKQNHLELYCCVQCGYRDGYQEPKNTELQETPKIDPEAQSAGHQERTGDVSQAVEHSCSPETDDNNEPTASTDCPEDPNSIISQGVITGASQHATNSGIEEPINSCEDAFSCSNSETAHNHDYGDCTRRKWGSISNLNQQDAQAEKPEDTSGSNDDASDLGSENHQQQASAINQDKQNMPIYAVYFKDPYSLQRHMRRSHGGKRERCPNCGKFMYKHDGRSMHVCSHEVKPFSCPTCERRFTSDARLQLHIQFHNENYRTSCMYCYKTFKQMKDKQQHEETHYGEKLKFHCPECPKRFACNNTRKAHLSTAHFKRGRFVCKVCDKGFHLEFKLRRHEVVHTGVKAYTCEVCARSFNQPGNLKSHMRVHTGEKPFMCHECGLCFNHNVSLKNHVQRKHRSASEGDDGYREEVWDDLITETGFAAQKK